MLYMKENLRLFLNLKIDDLFIASEGTMKLYIIYDDYTVWKKVYKTFTEAYAVVVAKVNSLNEEYADSSHYNDHTSFPSSMTDYNIYDVNDGAHVATINDELSVFIQMIDVDD